MDTSFSLKDEIWFLGVCHHFSNAVYEYDQKMAAINDTAVSTVDEKGYRYLKVLCTLSGCLWTFPSSNGTYAVKARF
jgi:hypothetical protein